MIIVVGSQSLLTLSLRCCFSLVEGGGVAASSDIECSMYTNTGQLFRVQHLHPPSALLSSHGTSTVRLRAGPTKKPPFLRHTIVSPVPRTSLTSVYRCKLQANRLMTRPAGKKMRTDIYCIRYDLNNGTRTGERKGFRLGILGRDLPPQRQYPRPLEQSGGVVPHKQQNSLPIRRVLS